MRTTTEGYYLQKKSTRNGVVLTFHNAFATAVENIVGSDNFIKITTGEFPEKNHAINAPELSIKKQTEFEFSASKEYRGGILSSVVTIRIGTGIGSGFILAENGILFNESTRDR